MKMIENANRFSRNNSFDRFAAFILESSTVDSMIRRFKLFRKLANTCKLHENFIFEAVDPIVSGATLAQYVCDLTRYYKCEFIYKVSERGKIIRDASGAIIGKSSCNVYRLDVNPYELNEALDDIKELLMKKFDL